MHAEKTTLVPQGLFLVVTASVWLAGIFLGSVISLPPLILLTGAGATLVLLLPLWHDSQARLILFLLFCLLLGMWRYSSALPSNTPQSIATYIGSTQLHIRGTVSDEPKLQGHSRLLHIDVSQVSSNGGHSWQGAAGKITARTPGTSIETPYGANYGDMVELQGKLQPPEPQPAPIIAASMAFPRISVQGSGGNPLLALIYHLRVLLANVIAQSLPQPEAALLIALLLSLHTPALNSLALTFNVTGTAHLIAASGFKVTVLAGSIANTLSGLAKKRSSPSKRRRVGGPVRWLTMAATMTTIVVYTLLSGAGPAALRAGIMGILLVLAPHIGRAYNIYTALSLTALLMSAIDPLVIWDVGFLLSFLGTLGIVLLTPLFEHLLHPLSRLPYSHTLVEIIAVTMAAQVATFPITAIVFQQISLIAPLANILTVPLLGTILPLGLMVGVGGLLFSQLGILCGWLAWPVLRYLVAVITLCASLPGAYITTDAVNNTLAWGYYILLAILITILLTKNVTAPTLALNRQMPEKASQAPLLLSHLWKLLQVGAAATTILATGITALTPQNNGYFSISFLDVGPAGAPSQGEAIFVRTSNGQTALIDGGLDPASLSQALDNRLPSWQRTLDMALLTSPRAEHITGLLDIIQRFQVQEVIDAGMLHPNTTYARWRRTITERNLRYLSVAQGMTIPIDAEVVLQVLWPLHLHKGSNEGRDNALIVRILAPGVRVLLLGAAAQSNYALTGLGTDLASNYLQAEIVQMVGEVNKPYPAALRSILQKAHPTVLIITPPLLRTKQNKGATANNLTPSRSVVPTGSDCQVIQTSQTGTVEIKSTTIGWSMNIL
jgi:ComEC/Rec2-related protein